MGRALLRLLAGSTTVFATREGAATKLRRIHLLPFER